MQNLQQLLSGSLTKELKQKRVKSLLVFSLFCAILVFVAASLFNSQIREFELAKLTQSVQIELRAAAAIDEERLGNLANEAQVLAKDGRIEYFFASFDSDVRQQLETFWLGVAWMNKGYTQMRLLDNNGLELVRIGYDPSKDLVEVGRNFKYHGDQYYLEHKDDLLVGGVYFSNVELHDNSVVADENSAAVFRAITPVVSGNGQRRGYLVLETNPAKQLRHYSEGYGHALGHKYILDEHGDFISAPDSSLLWSGQLPSRAMHNFARLYPKAWAAIQAADEGSLNIKEGRVVFKRLDLERFPYSKERYYAALIDNDNIYANTGGQMLMVWLAALLVVLLLSVWFWYRSGIGQERILQERMLKLIAVTFESNEALCISDPKGMIKAVNSAFCESTGYSMEETLGQSMSLLNSGHHDAEFYQQMWQELADSGVWKGEIWNKRKNGDIYPELLLISVVYDQQQKPLYFVSHFVDIREQKHMEKELRLAAAAFDTSVGGAITDTNGVIQRVNKAFTRITGYQVDEVVGLTPSVLSSGRHDRVFYSQMWDDLLEKGRWQGEIWNRRKNGDVYPEWITITAIKDDEGNTVNYVSSFEDITIRKELESELERMATTDSLTGCWNRRRFELELEQRLKQSRRYDESFSLLIFDIDLFKRVNDTFGHDVGDEVIKRVARSAEAQMRTVDSIARWGGEEFVMLLPNTNLAQAKVLADRVRKGIELAEGEPVVTCSFGVAEYRLGDDEDALLRSADQALYEAKADGRNCVKLALRELDESEVETLEPKE